MTHSSKLLLFLSLFCFTTIQLKAQQASLTLPIPKTYTAFKTPTPILVDGNTDDIWKNAPWTDFFQDIEGDVRPAPYFDTRVKMLWDDEYIYFYAELEEEHIWGDITERDAVIFHNNDFEIFILPNELQPYYAEFEVNALGTLWELFLARPYRRNGPVLDRWDVNGTQIGIEINGTLNDPSDIDSSWSVEMAIPLQAISRIDRGSKIEEGSMWRINFSRVQWQHVIEGGIYSRKTDTNGKRLPENNWVWSQQSAIDMHRPENWGYLYFSEEDVLSEGLPYQSDYATEYQFLHYLYRKQLAENGQNGPFTTDLTNGVFDYTVNGISMNYQITLTKLGFEITVSSESGNELTINQDGCIAINP